MASDLPDANNETPLADPLELLTPVELADLLKVTPRWINDAANRGTLPYILLGRDKRFERRQIYDAIQRMRVPGRDGGAA